MISIGADAPRIPGVALDGPAVVVFYKVTCPTCQMAGPKLDAFARAYGEHVVGVGQDPAEALDTFSRTYEMSFLSVPDLPPYDVSNAFGIEHVPTVVVVDGEGTVADVVESWDRDGLNRASSTVAALLDLPPATISAAGDGLPAFRPG